MDFIINFLKSLFDKFRIANPTAAAVVLLALSVITYGAVQGSVLGLIQLEGIAQQIVSWVGLFLTAVIGSGAGSGSTAKK